uniref:Uncharacterized protein n=1 Tax=Macrostomum lignano TaxID=282301 RepID=A0A1I8JID9_9PLAT
MPKRQECALTISSEHSDLAAASVIWFTCCSQAAAAAAAIRAGSQSICEFSGGSEENPSGTGLKRKRRSVLDSEVSHASDMPKRQECALTISSEHSDLAAASVIWFTCCSQAAQQQQPLSVQAVSLFVNFLVDLKKTRPAQD